MSRVSKLLKTWLPDRLPDQPPAVEPALFTCALADMCHSGWFQNETGELFTGFPLGPGETFLDVGCGNGGASMFAARMGCDVIATDVMPEKIVTLEEKLAALGAVSHRCLVSDSSPLPLPDGTASRIACCEVLEHVPDPAAFLTELVRVGTPQALYLLTAPDPASEEVMRDFAPASYWQPPNHVRIFARQEFAKLVEQAGLVVESRHYYGFYHTVWWSLWAAEEQERQAEPGPNRRIWDVSQGESPMLAAWSRSWSELLTKPDGMRIKRALDRTLPKSQIIVARKAA